MSDITVRTNLPDFRRQLRDLGEKTEKKIVRAAARKGPRTIGKAVQQQAPVKQGVLRRAIISVSRRGERHVVKFSVFARHGRAERRVGKKGINRDAFYWSWVEQGHRIVKRGQSLSRRGERSRALQRGRFDKAGGGRVAGVWYMRGGFQQSSTGALQTIMADIGKGIEKASRER